MPRVERRAAEAVERSSAPPSQPPAAGGRGFVPRKVSVIIPARNEEASIGGIVRAVLAQHAGEIELELIVVVDASTDDTEGAARAAGARTLYGTASGKGNAAAARNVGAREAAGDVLVFLDADCTPDRKSVV